MTDAEQFLADLEAKAKDIESKMWQAVRKEFSGDISYDVDKGENGDVVAYDLSPEDALFIAAADPVAVLRLVGMVRKYDNEILRLREENERLKLWANAEGAARQCHMKVAYYLMKAIDNGGFEIVAQIPMFKEANSLQDAADAARKAVEEACPKK